MELSKLRLGLLSALTGVALVSFSACAVGGGGDDLDEDEDVTYAEDNAPAPTPAPVAAPTQTPAPAPAQDADDENENEAAVPTQAPATASGSISSGLASILFDFDRFNIRADMQKNIDAAASEILSSNARVVLEGHTDSFGSDEYNFALGKKRADSVKKALVNAGVSEDNIMTVTYGESKPICLDKSISCYKENRRVEFKNAK